MMALEKDFGINFFTHQQNPLPQAQLIATVCRRFGFDDPGLLTSVLHIIFLSICLSLKPKLDHHRTRRKKEEQILIWLNIFEVIWTYN